MQQPDQFKLIIQQTLSAQEELIALLQQQREALVDQDEQRVQCFTQQLYHQLATIANCQQQWEEMCAARQLSPHLYGQLGHTLQRTTQRAQFEGQLNQEIIVDLLAYMDYSLRLLVPEQYISNGYDAQGRREMHTGQQLKPRQINEAA